MKSLYVKKIIIASVIEILVFYLFVFFCLGKGGYSYDPSGALPVLLWLVVLIIINFFIAFFAFILRFYNFAKLSLIVSVLMIPIGSIIFFLPFEIESSNYEIYRFRIKTSECSIRLNLTKEHTYWLNLDYSLRETGDLLYSGTWFNVNDTTKFKDQEGMVAPFYILNQKLYKLPNNPRQIQLDLE